MKPPTDDVPLGKSLINLKRPFFKIVLIRKVSKVLEKIELPGGRTGGSCRLICSSWGTSIGSDPTGTGAGKAKESTGSSLKMCLMIPCSQGKRGESPRTDPEDQPPLTAMSSFLGQTSSALKSKIGLLKTCKAPGKTRQRHSLGLKTCGLKGLNTLNVRSTGGELLYGAAEALGNAFKIIQTVF